MESWIRSHCKREYEVLEYQCSILVGCLRLSPFSEKISEVNIFILLLDEGVFPPSEVVFQSDLLFLAMKMSPILKTVHLSGMSSLFFSVSNWCWSLIFNSEKNSNFHLWTLREKKIEFFHTWLMVFLGVFFS